VEVDGTKPSSLLLYGRFSPLSLVDIKGPRNMEKFTKNVIALASHL